MEKDQVEELKKAFKEIVAAPPFNGEVTHRTRALFISKWKDHLTAKGIKGAGYLDDLLKALGSR